MPKNISFVAKEDLCAGCGICMNICPSQCISININKNKGIFYPKLDEQKCNLCGFCLKVCPGINSDFSQDIPEHWLSLPSHPYVGHYSSIYLGFSKNQEIQFNGASGGMVTAFLLYLLENNFIDGAVVTRMCESDPLKAEPFIAKTRQELIEAQKSKYCPVSLGNILKELENYHGRYALVGLPCHISGIRKLLKYKKALLNKISFLIGLFCSRTPSFNATLHLLMKKGISLNEVLSLQYRGYGHPGFMTVQLKNGEIIKIPHLDYDYWGYMFYKFFIPPRCYLCPDKLAFQADISMGDNWSHLLKQPKGSSTIVVREPLCGSILQKMKKDNLITLEEIDLNVLITSQDLDNKCNIPPRVKLWRFTGGLAPDYGKLELMRRDNTFADVLNALPQFIMFSLSKKQRNYTVLRVTSRIFWTIDKVKKLSGKLFNEFYILLNSLIPAKSNTCLKKARYKVIMIGGFGCHDIGDEAMPHADRLNFKKKLGEELEIVMFSPYPEYTRQFHNEYAVKDLNELSPSFAPGIKSKLVTFRAFMRSILFILGAYLQKHNLSLRLWSSGREAIHHIASCDLLFNVGGGNLNSLIPQELYKKGVTYLVARILDKPIIISGQTIGPFSRKIDKLFARFCLNKATMITFRDKEVSHKRLLSIGVSKPVMIDAADDAMTLPFIHRDDAENILKRETGKGWLRINSHLKVAMNLKGSLKVFKRGGQVLSIKKEIELMAKIADRIIERFNAKVVFIPTDYCPDVDDREVHAKIISKMHNKEYAKSVEGEYDDITLKGLIGLFDLAIGARYHFCVFAASMYVPFLGIASGVYQQTKLKGLADLCQLPQCFISEDMEFTTIQEIWPKIEKFIEGREYIKKKLKEVIPVLEEKSLYGVKEAIRLLVSKTEKDQKSR